jgi:hypothetical protein
MDKGRGLKVNEARKGGEKTDETSTRLDTISRQMLLTNKKPKKNTSNCFLLDKNVDALRFD